MHNVRMLLMLAGAVGIMSACSTNKDSLMQAPIRVMSFNIRYNNPGDGENAWPHRKDMVASMMQFHKADLVGIQEALKEQTDDLAELLPEYKWIGVGRDDGKEAGEYSAIFIDYIFVNKNVQVAQHGVLSDRWNGRYPSDHLPVLAELIF